MSAHPKLMPLVVMQWTMIDAVNRWIDSEPLERYGEQWYKE